MANLLPTKGNLIAAKRSRMLAQTGYCLLYTSPSPRD